MLHNVKTETQSAEPPCEGFTVCEECVQPGSAKTWRGYNKCTCPDGVHVSTAEGCDFGLAPQLGAFMCEVEFRQVAGASA